MVLGLVGRDLLLDAVQAVADEDASAAFTLAGRAVELGYDLRAVCRDLARLVRDLLVLSVDPSRIADPEIAGEGERDRLKGLAGRFSREDFLRAFDLLTRAEVDIRTAAQPRYHLEMVLLRWIYLRKITPIEDLIAGKTPMAEVAGPQRLGPRAPAAPAPGRPLSVAPVVRSSTAPAAHVSPATAQTSAAGQGSNRPGDRPPAARPDQASAPGISGNVKDPFLAEIRKSKVVFYNTVVAQAQKIEVVGDRITFTFLANQRTLRDAFEEKRGWLESIALQATGRKLTVAAVQAEPGAGPGVPVKGDDAGEAKKAEDRKNALREQALADVGVQTMLEVFPAEIRDVEEM
jgi:DNA polymerase-3 subunit gamma/tau